MPTVGFFEDFNSFVPNSFFFIAGFLDTPETACSKQNLFLALHNSLLIVLFPALSMWKKYRLMFPASKLPVSCINAFALRFVRSMSYEFMA
jgi:hypothetical protein